MTRATLLFAAVCGCKGMDSADPRQACYEAGYAIAYVTEECTSDRDLANARYEAFADGWSCIPRGYDDPELAELGLEPEQMYDCAYAIGLLPCEVVADFGGDIASYLAISPACPLVAEPKGGAK